MEKKTRQKRIVSVKTIAWSLAGLGMAIVGLLVASLCMLSFQFEDVKRTTEDYVDLKYIDETTKKPVKTKSSI